MKRKELVKRIGKMGCVLIRNWNMEVYKHEYAYTNFEELTMFRKLLVTFLLTTIPLIIGCAHSIILNPNIQPNVYTVKKIDGDVGVVFTDKLLSHVEHVRPSTYTGSAHTYNFEVGIPLKSALLRATEAVCNNVSTEDNSFDLSNYEYAYKFDLENCQICITFQEGFLFVSSNANVNISVSVEMYDFINGAGLTNRITISGSGFYSGQSDAFTSDQQFSKAVEDAIKQISESFANTLISQNK